jgi:hypothetical protein
MTVQLFATCLGDLVFPTAVALEEDVLVNGVDTGGLFGLMDPRERVFYDTVVD